MAYPDDFGTASITLPLDTVLALLKASKGNLSEETDSLMKLEVGGVLCSLDLTEEQIAETMEGAFGDTLGPERCS